MQTHYLTDTLCSYIVCLVQGSQECDKQYVITADGKKSPFSTTQALTLFAVAFSALQGGYWSMLIQCALCYVDGPPYFFSYGCRFFL